MATHARSIDDLNRIGGALCLDFTNTIGWRQTPEPVDWLTGYDDLVRWCGQSGIIGKEEADRLLSLAARKPSVAAETLDTARVLRWSLYRIFSALAHDRQQAAADLEALNGMLPDTLARLRLAPVAGGFQWQWRPETQTLDGLLRPIIRSAADLLTSPEARRVKECANDGCAWVFLDTSRNRSRRWCDMNECGNRVKARRHYRRTRTTEA